MLLNTLSHTARWQKSLMTPPQRRRKFSSRLHRKGWHKTRSIKNGKKSFQFQNWRLWINVGSAFFFWIKFSTFALLRSPAEQTKGKIVLLRCNSLRRIAVIQFQLVQISSERTNLSNKWVTARAVYEFKETYSEAEKSFHQRNIKLGPRNIYCWSLRFTQGCQNYVDQIILLCTLRVKTCSIA